MSKIYFNRPIIKHVEETTVINFFWQKDEREAIFIRDTRPDVYRDNYLIIGEVEELYQNPFDKTEWYADIVEMKEENYSVFGFYTGEGIDFEIAAPGQPLFMIRQKETELSLSTVPYMHQGGEVNEVTFGLFRLGTEIKFRRDGVQIIDKLMSDGWKRIVGPSDHSFGIITVEEAFQEKLRREEDMKNPTIAQEMLSETIERIHDAKRKHEIHPELADSLVRYKEPVPKGEDGIMFYFLARDIKDLHEKGIIL